MIAVAVLGVGICAFARYQRNWTHYARGWWDAERELWRGEATIYLEVLGIPVGDPCYIDRDTGLPEHSLSCCVVRTGGSERVKGHNDHIAQYIRWNGLPENSLKPWEKELFDLKRYFGDRSRTEAPKRLLAGGPAVVSPGGRNSVRLVAGVKRDLSPDALLEVVITAEHIVCRERYVPVDNGDSDLLWGPEGSRFAVIRSISEWSEKYAAYDLRTGRHLRAESRDTGKHLSESEVSELREWVRTNSRPGERAFQCDR